MNFELHPRLTADCLVIGDLPLSRLLLMNDAQYPWCILVPRRTGAREIYLLDEADQQQLWRESAQLSAAIMDLFRGEKLNIGALGNMVPQLHVHHIVRHAADAAWPGPVWGKHPAQLYTAEHATRQVQQIQSKMRL